LILRACRDEALVRDEEDWEALAAIAERMLFWCGGAIHGCRFEEDELCFAIELARAPIGSMVSHLSGAYARHLRRRRGWTGPVFKHYGAIVLDAELYLDDLVIWLHRLPEPNLLGLLESPCWTADTAYRIPGSLTWITTARVLDALGGSGTVAYRRRLARPIAPEILAVLLRPFVRRRNLSRVGDGANNRTEGTTAPNPWTCKGIAQMVAERSHISYEDMISTSRKRSVCRAKAIAAVLSTRNGASAADVARLFRRSRSALIEQVEHYRKTQPELFVDADRALDAYPARVRLPLGALEPG